VELAALGANLARGMPSHHRGAVRAKLVFPSAVLARWFGLPPFALAAMSSGFGLAGLLLAWITGLATSRVGAAYAQCNGDSLKLDVGYGYQLHWVIGYVIVIPAALAAAATSLRRLSACVEMLAKAGILQPDASPVAASERSTPRDLSWVLRWGVPIALASVQVGGWWPTVFRYYYLSLRGYPFQCPKGPPFRPEVDWSIACLGWKEGQVGLFANLLFTSYAVVVDVTAGFLLAVWFSHMVVAIYRLWSKLLSRTPGFRFDPIVFDPMRRFGLHSLGRVYDSLFLTLVLFGFQSCLKHLSRMRRVLGVSEVAYLTSGGHFSISRIEESLPAFDSVDAVLLSLACLSLVFLLLLPSFTVVRLVDRYRDDLFTARIRQFESASRAAVDTDKAYEAQFRALARTEVWPNGEAAYFWIAGYFALTAWPLCPVGIPLVVSMGVAAKPVVAMLLGRGGDGGGAGGKA
jgi:hypothetical protein